MSTVVSAGPINLRLLNAIAQLAYFRKLTVDHMISDVEVNSELGVSQSLERETGASLSEIVHALHELASPTSDNPDLLAVRQSLIERELIPNPNPEIAAKSTNQVDATQLSSDEMFVKIKTLEHDKKDEILSIVIKRARIIGNVPDNELKIPIEQITAAVRTILTSSDSTLAAEKELLVNRLQEAGITMPELTPSDAEFKVVETEKVYKNIALAIQKRYDAKIGYINSIALDSKTDSRAGIYKQMDTECIEPSTVTRIFKGVDTFRRSKITTDIYFFGSSQAYNEYLEKALKLFVEIIDITEAEINGCTDVEECYQKILGKDASFEEYLNKVEARGYNKEAEGVRNAECLDFQKAIEVCVIDNDLPQAKEKHQQICALIGKKFSNFKDQSKIYKLLGAKLEAAKNSSARASLLENKRSCLKAIKDSDKIKFKITDDELEPITSLFETIETNKFGPQDEPASHNSDANNGWFEAIKKHTSSIVLVATGVLGVIGLLVKGGIGKLLTAIGFGGFFATLAAKFYKHVPTWLSGAQEQVPASTTTSGGGSS
ncbi:MAG: hypothetical protein A3B68_03805 [Candidatus Melainabacteria bacterium RIFCSPHIGHO2_02_FULL_34_12]|nr:MAG: hypothetical protein A3B68_03805 [Candidatus Melainabacteria bacterium RIFCSPHIGHO2_02_FULL_34_12]